MQKLDGSIMGQANRASVRAAIALALALVACAITLGGCANGTSAADNPSGSTANSTTNASSEPSASSTHSTQSSAAAPERVRVYVPLEWDAGATAFVGRQGSAGLWGTCGECVIANTLNLVTGSTYTEADIVDFVMQRGLCDASSGGMSVNDMMRAYRELLPIERIDIFCYDGDAALTIDQMAEKIERGIALNVSVYGEMMREGGHADEGDVFTTHWILAHGVERDADGAVAGFWIADSASDITYLSVQELSDVCFGRDGTCIVNPNCIQVFGWEYAEGATRAGASTGTGDAGVSGAGTGDAGASDIPEEDIAPEEPTLSRWVFSS